VLRHIAGRMHAGDSEPLPPIEDSEAKRVEIFSDGILAISITLLVIEIRRPRRCWGSARIGVAWTRFRPTSRTPLVRHDRDWCGSHTIDVPDDQAYEPRTADAEPVVLLCVAFLPFSTAVLAQYASSGKPEPSSRPSSTAPNAPHRLAFLGLWAFLYAVPSLLAANVERRQLRDPSSVPSSPRPPIS